MEYAIRPEFNNFKILTYDDMLNIEGGGFWASLGKAALVTVAAVAIATAPITIGLAVIGGASMIIGYYAF